MSRFIWPGLIRDAQVSCGAPCSSRMLGNAMFSNGFWRVSVCILWSSNHQRTNGNTFPKYGILLLVWNVTAANGFWWFRNNRKIFALASRVPLARTVPHQGRASEMQGIPMVFKVAQLIPRRRQDNIHLHPLFQWREPIDFHWFYKVFRLTVRFPGREFFGQPNMLILHWFWNISGEGVFWPFDVDSLSNASSFHVICQA